MTNEQLAVLLAQYKDNVEEIISAITAKTTETKLVGEALHLLMMLEIRLATAVDVLSPNSGF